MSDKQVLDEKFYSLIPLGEFKSLLGVDDREDRISLFCLVISNLTLSNTAKCG